MAELCSDNMSWPKTPSSVPILSIFIALHLVILPYLCSDCPYSVYFNTDRERVVPEDEVDLLLPGDHAEVQIEESDLAVLVLTAAREQDYLRRTLLSLFRELTIGGARHQVYLCSAEVEQPELESIASMASIPGLVVMQPCQEHICQEFEKEEREQKYIHDFVVCHQEVEDYLGSQVKYLLVIEDDVMLMPSFFSTLSSILTFYTAKMASSPWLDLKLYLTPRLRGYAWDTEPMIELLATSGLISILSELILRQAGLRMPRNGPARHLLLYSLVLVTLLAISRQQITPVL